MRNRPSLARKSRAPVWLALCLAVGAGIAAASWHASAQTGILSGQAEVKDGDSLRIGEDRVVLWGVDAPEGETRCGQTLPEQQATEALERIIGSREVQCEVRNVDSQGRKVSVCRVGRRDLAATMVEQGWARDYPRYSCSFYAEQEAAARQARRGVWALQCPAELWGDRNYAADRCRPAEPAQ